MERYRLIDRSVLNGLEGCPGNRTGYEILLRLQQLRWPEQAPDNIYSGRDHISYAV